MSWIRLNKRIAQLGLASRREADDLIQRGLVRVNGCAVKVLGTRVHAQNDVVEVAPDDAQQRRTIIFNKPIGVVSGLPQKQDLSALAYINHLNHFGRMPSPSPQPTLDRAFVEICKKVL